MRALLLFLALMFILAAAPAREGAPVVVEIMTSQGCHDAPPYEAYFGALAAQDPDLLVLNCHVTYFDHKGWKDEFASPLCDQRHFEYFRTLRLSNIVTPEIVINGRQATGRTDEYGLHEAVQLARVEKPLIPLLLKKEGADITITLPAFTPPAPLDIWLYTYRPNDNTDVTAGANRGMTLNHFNTVANLEKIGTWDGTQTTITYDTGNDKGMGYIALLQEYREGPIIAAGRLGD